MLKEMGNQNTSGIVEKEQVGCPDYMEQENEIKTQQILYAKVTKSDSCDSQVKKNPPMESVAHDGKEAKDGYPSEDSETKANGLPDSTGKDEKIIEDHTQLSSDLSNVSPEDINITSNPQEIKTLSHSVEKCDTKLLVQNCASSDDSSIDDRVVTNREDGFVEAETPSVEGESIEMCAHQENCDLSGSTENGIRNEKGEEDHSKVEMGSFLNAPHGLQTVSKDTSALECQVKDGHLVLEETLIANKLSNEAHISYVDQTQAEEEVQCINEVDQMVKEIGLVDTKGSVRLDENGEEEELTDETTMEEIGMIGNRSYALCKDREDGTTTEECSSKVGSSSEIKKVNEPECEPECEPETGHPAPVQYSNNKTTTPQVRQSNGVASVIEKFIAKSEFESSMEIKKLNQLEPELGLVFLEQYTNNQMSRLLVVEPNGGEITVERCGLKSESSLVIKKMDEPVLPPEPEHEVEPGFVLPKQDPFDKTSSIQGLEPNGGENIVEKCKLASEYSSQIKKVDESESGHLLPEQISINKTSMVQVPELDGGENIMEKCRSTCQFLLEIKQVNKSEHETEPGHVFCEQHPDIERSTLQVLGQNGPVRSLEKCRSKSESRFEIKTLHESELTSKSECKPKAEPDSKQKLPVSKEGENIEKSSKEPITNHTIIQLELRKSPSFEFGVPFDSRSVESDQTPFLYQDRTAPRRFSSSSYVSPLHQEAVEVEEKTIRMERSTSDVSRSPFLNLLKEEKPENFAAGKKDKKNGLNSSLPTEDCDGISTRRNGKRKPRSSLFTTCICCTSSAFS